MTLDHAPHSRSIRDDSNTIKQPLLTQSRETGDVIPPKQPDGTPIAAAASPFAKSWAHLVAGGWVIRFSRFNTIRDAELTQIQARWNGIGNLNSSP